MKKRSARNPLLLILAAFIWGVAFVAQKDGMNYVEPFTFNGARSLIAAGVLWLMLPPLDKARARGGDFQKGSRRSILLGGVVCGGVMFIASNLQQYGVALQDPATNVGKAGFITACYTVIVPILGLFLGKKTPRLVWAGAAIALAGFFFLSLMDGLAAGQGLDLGTSDLLLLLCAVMFSVHILVIDHFSPLADGVRLSCIQFLVCGLMSLPCMLLWEHPSLSALAAAWLPLLYSSIMSSCVAYTPQIIAQKGVHPAVASLLLSLESVFAVLAGYVLMPGSGLSRWELLGCVLVFAAVVLVQLAPAPRQD